jgi:hypothetical protein
VSYVYCVVDKRATAPLHTDQHLVHHNFCASQKKNKKKQTRGIATNSAPFQLLHSRWSHVTFFSLTHSLLEKRTLVFLTPTEKIFVDVGDGN